jgi:hypothetical protein
VQDHRDEDQSKSQGANRNPPIKHPREAGGRTPERTANEHPDHEDGVEPIAGFWPKRVDNVLVGKINAIYCWVLSRYSSEIGLIGGGDRGYFFGVIFLYVLGADVFCPFALVDCQNYNS